MYDKTGTMCLIDPQSHLCVITYLLFQYTHWCGSSEQSSMDRVYWNGGPNAIECFMTHHLKKCQNNMICNALHLQTVEFEDSDSDGLGTSNHFKSVSPRKCSTHSQGHRSSTRLVANKPLRIGA
jgi:hypothetical protein